MNRLLLVLALKSVASHNVPEFTTVRVASADLDAEIRTAFVRSPSGRGRSSRSPPVLLIHGADASSVEEWRLLMPRLAARGMECTAVDWWSGGFTDRRPILRRLRRWPRAQPWTLIRQHLHAFWQQEFSDQPVLLVGASMGGAVALDYASTHPEAVAALVLLDAGGESYASPPPTLCRVLAPLAIGVKATLAFVERRSEQSAGRAAGTLHRAEPGWLEALSRYLFSGGYARRVGPERIRAVACATLVVWGKEDGVLPLKDAFAFERDLPRCAGVRVVEGAGHTPHLEAPDVVANHIAEFAASQR